MSDRLYLISRQFPQRSFCPVRTENYVWIPTEVSPNSDDIVLALTGEHVIRASRKGFSEYVVAVFICSMLLIIYSSQTTTVGWQLTITVSTTSGRLNVQINHDSDMDPQDNTALIDPYSPEERIKKRLDGLVASAQEEMNKQFNGTSLHNWFALDEENYRFSNPIFTRSSDLVYEGYKTSSGNLTIHTVLT